MEEIENKEEKSLKKHIVFIMEKIENKEEKSLKKYIDFIKEYFAIISFSIISILLIIDYFIFTDVLHLNQAYFFNNLLGVIAQEQPILLIFVILPTLFTSLIFILLYKIQFDYLNKLFNDNYKNSYTKFNKIKFKIFFIFFSILIILFGDIIIFFIVNFIFNILEGTSFEMTVFPFIFTTYTLFVIYNLIIFYLILIISSPLIIKFKNIFLIQYFIVIIFVLKLFIYPFFQFIPYLKEIPIKSFTIFILFNLIFFILATANIIRENYKVKRNIKQDKNKKNNFYTLLKKAIILLFIIFCINIYFFNLNKIYHEPYTKKDFWNKLSQNNLFNSNISLLMSPLKILKDTEKGIKKGTEKEKVIKNIKEKFIQKFASINLDKKFSSDLNYFYLPFKDFSIIFIQDKNENIMLTAYALFKEDKVVKILDVGYIDLD